MKKSELFNMFDKTVQFYIDDSSLGQDLHNVAIPSDKYDNVFIIGHFGKRCIEGVTVAFPLDDAHDDLDVAYDVTASIIEHPATDGDLFKESDFLDKEAAVKSMYDTILAAVPNINALLTEYSLETLRSHENKTRFTRPDYYSYWSTLPLEA